MSAAKQLTDDQKRVLEENVGDEKKSLLSSMLEAEADLKKSRGKFSMGFFCVNNLVTFSVTKAKGLVEILISRFETLSHEKKELLKTSLQIICSSDKLGLKVWIFQKCLVIWATRSRGVTLDQSRNKYILKYGPILFTIQTNTIWNSDKYNLHFRQILFGIQTNTIVILKELLGKVEDLNTGSITMESITMESSGANIFYHFCHFVILPLNQMIAMRTRILPADPAEQNPQLQVMTNVTRHNHWGFWLRKWKMPRKRKGDFFIWMISMLRCRWFYIDYFRTMKRKSDSPTTSSKLTSALSLYKYQGDFQWVFYLWEVLKNLKPHF